MSVQRIQPTDNRAYFCGILWPVLVSVALQNSVANNRIPRPREIMGLVLTGKQWHISLYFHTLPHNWFSGVHFHFLHELTSRLFHKQQPNIPKSIHSTMVHTLHINQNASKSTHKFPSYSVNKQMNSGRRN